MSLLVFLYHFLLFQTFYGNDSSTFVLPAKSYLTKCTSSDHRQRSKVLLTYLLSPLPQIVHLFMDYLLFCLLLLLWWELKLWYFLCEYFPLFCSLFGFHLVHAVFFLYIAFGSLCLLLRHFWYLYFFHKMLTVILCLILISLYLYHSYFKHYFILLFLYHKPTWSQNNSNSRKPPKLPSPSRRESSKGNTLWEANLDSSDQGPSNLHPVPNMPKPKQPLKCQPNSISFQF